MTKRSHTPVSDAAGSLQTIRASRQFLQQYSPYADIPEGLLEQALAQARLAYYAEGEALIGPDDGIPTHFCVVQQGLVTGRRVDHDTDSPLFESGPGETFLNVALLEGRPTQTEHIAAQDSFVIEVPRKGFDLLLAGSPAFRDFCERRASTLVERARQRMRSEAALDMQGQLSLDTPLSELLSGTTVTCLPETAVSEAVRLMHESEIGSIVIVDAQGHTLGIFTLRDLRAMVARGEHGLDTAIGEVMTPDPCMLPADRPAYEAAQLMLEHHFGHLLVGTRDLLEGIISERDLFALQRVNMVQLARRIQKAADISELRAVRPHIHELIRAMLAQGASARQLTGLITRLNDAMVSRVITLCRQDWHEPVSDFTWLSFGSEARGEQTLSTDQDNGMLFEADSQTAEDIRRQLLPLARQINQTLDQVGFPLCRGNIMASNPALCLSREEWQEKFRSIIQTSSDQHLLDATIYLDCRSLYGDTGQLTELRDGILALAADNTIFQHALARHALEHRPPIGVFNSLITERSAQGRSLDLKKNGLTPIISSIRVLTLANRIPQINTEDRLDALAEAGIIPAQDAAAWKEAFSFIQLLRLRNNQGQMEQEQSLTNHIDPAALNPLDRRILKEALRQAQRLQTRLRLDYT